MKQGLLIPNIDEDIPIAKNIIEIFETVSHKISSLISTYSWCGYYGGKL